MQDVKRTCVGQYADDVVVLPLDITASWESVSRFAEQADAAFGGLDYVFHVAGVYNSDFVFKITLDIICDTLIHKTIIIIQFSLNIPNPFYTEPLDIPNDFPAPMGSV